VLVVSLILFTMLSLDTLFAIFFLAVALSAIWLILSLFRRIAPPTPGKKQMKPGWVRLVTILPVLVLLAPALILEH